MDPLGPLISTLHDGGRLRVWSLVITVFGDMVQHRGGVISTARLGLLLGRVGIEQGTLRTALSRLGRDGWVTRTRDGRTSLYRLSAEGVDRFAPATSLIYAPPAAPPDNWAMWAVLEAGAPTLRVGPAGSAPEAADCIVTGSLDRVSDAFRASLLTPDHRAALDDLAQVLGALPGESATPLDAAAARMLLVHRWRRLVLRFPDIPAALMPEGAAPRDPRRAVSEAYAALTARAEAWLDAEVEGLPAMPPASAPATARFGRA
jgi:phenylacetic acid degradation operon negative regulatory protein